jgi:hypothetical protein
MDLLEFYKILFLDIQNLEILKRSAHRGVKMPRWLVRLLSQEAGKWLGTSINSGICTVEQ